MLEWILVVLVCSFGYTVAEKSNKSGIIWGAVLFLVSVIAMLAIPLPMLRVLIGAALGIVLLIAADAIRGK